MQFGLFGSAAARRPTSAEAGEFDSSEGFRDFIRPLSKALSPA
jgi:hypothetical protein